MDSERSRLLHSQQVSQANLAGNAREGCRHVMTIDLEEWYDSLSVEQSEKTCLRSDLPRHTEILLTAMKDKNVKATFFVLGTVAREHPGLVRTIADAGHEIAAHGWDHTPINLLTPSAFKQSVRRCKRQLENLVGQPVLGYRAPFWSLEKCRYRASLILEKAGFLYDSSFSPVLRQPHWRGLPWLYRIRGCERLLELPAGSVSVCVGRVPFGHGVFLGWRSVAYSIRVMRARLAAGQPSIICFHPHQLERRRIPFRVPLWQRILHHPPFDKSPETVFALMGAVPFTSIRNMLSDVSVRVQLTRCES